MTQKIFIEKKNQLEEEGGEFLLVRVCTKRKQERNVNQSKKHFLFETPNLFGDKKKQNNSISNLVFRVKSREFDLPARQARG